MIILGAWTTILFFEHLGGNTEEQQWANYRIAESQRNYDVGKMTNYNELSGLSCKHFRNDKC
jgi:hypothetical protein